MSGCEATRVFFPFPFQFQFQFLASLPLWWRVCMTVGDKGIYESIEKGMVFVWRIARG